MPVAVHGSAGRRSFRASSRVHGSGGGAAFSVGEQHVLFSMAPFVRAGAIHSYAVAPDDQRFLMVREGDASQQGELVVAENWVGELRGRVGR
jgi:hypothetical protein